MTIKLVSFDLQGTLCAHDFSSEVWLKLLPQVFHSYGEKQGTKARQQLLDEFEQVNESDYRYYDIEYWLKRAGSQEDTFSLASKANAKPKAFLEVLDLIDTISKQLPIIIISATTHKFIELETANWTSNFASIYSSLDDFNQPGKPPELFSSIAQQWGLAPEQCIHFGDHQVFDLENPRKTGWLAHYDCSTVTPTKRAESIQSSLKNLI